MANTIEADLPYRKSYSMAGDPQEPAACKMASNAEFYPTKRRVTVDGWDSKPSNKAAGLMQALADQGSIPSGMCYIYMYIYIYREYIYILLYYILYINYYMGA